MVSVPPAGGGGPSSLGVAAHPQYANYWAPLTRKRHIPPHSAQLQHTNYWAPRTRKRHQQEHRPQRPTERSDPTQHAKGRTGDCPGPREGATTRRNVTQGVDMGGKGMVASAMIGFATWASHTRSSWEYHAVVATVSADDSTSELLGPWNLHGLTLSPACARATRPRGP